jgi:drug/metabolite transporter (DMT)-like permease
MRLECCMAVAAIAVTTAFPLSAALAVIGAGMLHATWNAMAKAADDRRAVFALYGSAWAACGVIGAVIAPMPAAAAWPWLSTSSVLHVIYAALLVRSYHLGDFNQVYPLARGTAPLLVAIVATAFVGDRMTIGELVGVAVICAGLGLLALARPRRGDPGVPQSRARAVRAAVLTGVSIAAYTLSDGLGVRASGSALGYASWLFLISGPLTLAWAVSRRDGATWRSARENLGSGLAGGVLGVVAYGIVLWAQTTGALAVVAALRETGVITGAIIGVAVFRERAATSRIVAAVTVAAGAALINLH